MELNYKELTGKEIMEGLDRQFNEAMGAARTLLQVLNELVQINQAEQGDPLLVTLMKSRNLTAIQKGLEAFNKQLT